MKLLAIVIALLCRKMNAVPAMTDFKDAVSQGVQKLSELPLTGWAQYAVVVLIPLLLVHLLYEFLGNWIFGLVGLVFSIALFFLIWNDRPIEEFLERYLPAWQSGQLQPPLEIGSQYFPVKEQDALDDVHRHVWDQWLLTWNAQIFAPLLWFWLFGPLLLVWMLVNRSLIGSSKIGNDLTQAASQVQQFFFWVTGRVLALTFMISGSFAAIAKKVAEGLTDWDIPTSQLLHETALTALGLQPLKEDKQSMIDQAGRQLTALESLLSRSLVTWLVLMALWTIFCG